MLGCGWMGGYLLVVNNNKSTVDFNVALQSVNAVKQIVVVVSRTPFL